jgi:chromosome segregation protein
MPLRLKSLELHGYKTFAARTFFEFASGITAIVGPNGAGKSNIADSLRWVLGEQSYSLLRGKKTEDMIFSGSEHRPRVGMASAEVIFDNSAGWLPVDFAEVGMTRRAYRDGHNDYLLNGQHVLLREMNELLAAAGLSERTYTIVGQGLVDASLALKADERRRLFEEAAGVGLYRVRREEAMRRLENTRRNLERVHDIMAEIEPRLKTLERQARRANEYAAAQADLREVLREWYGYHWHRAQQDLQEAQESVQRFQERAKAARTMHESQQAEYSEFRRRLAQMRAQVNAWHRDLADVHLERESVNVALALMEERRRAASASAAATSARRQAAAGEEELARQRFGELDVERRRSQSEMEEAVDQRTAAHETLKQAELQRGILEGELQAARERLVGRSAQRAQTQARLDDLGARLELQRSRLEASAQAIDVAQREVDAAREALRQAQIQTGDSDKRRQSAAADVEAARASASRSEELRGRILEERAALLSRHSRLEAQLQVLEQAEESLAGYADGARFLIDAARQSKLHSRGALTAILDLPAELEVAIGAALGEAVDAVLLDSGEVERALKLLESDDAGRAALLAADSRSVELIKPPVDPELLGIASQLVQAPAELRASVDRLLGSTLVVRTRAAAQRLVGSIPAHGRIVTLRGEVFRGDGLITAGKTAASSILSRPRQKRELSAAITDLTAQLHERDARIDEVSRALESARRAVSDCEVSLANAQVRLQEDHVAEQQAELELERRRRLLEWETSRHEEYLPERSGAETDKENLIVLVAEHESRSVGERQEIARLTSAISGLGLAEAQDQASYWSTRAAVAEQTAAGIETRMLEYRQAAERIAMQMQGIDAQIAELGGEITQFESEKAALAERENALTRAAAALQDLLAPAEKELEQAEKQEGGHDESEGAAWRGASNAERVSTQAEIDLVRRQEALDSLRGRIVDDFGLVSFEYAAHVEGPVPLPFEGLVEELSSVAELRPDLEEALAQRRSRLRRLGLINPEAAREYEAESERYSFMSAQVQDLHQADADLRHVVSELDGLTRQEFARTFAAVDKQFRSTFARLFGGGSARLSLTDPDNLIETGIEIEARLPGRREQGLALLSGGERSLTAIALIFALLKISPTPVCVLDEVDAMLDEANVGRFRDLLKELSQETQFIIITHNRNTVQAADFIYGVTMGRDSTSQTISLKLDEVSEEMLGAGRG